MVNHIMYGTPGPCAQETTYKEPRAVGGEQGMDYPEAKLPLNLDCGYRVPHYSVGGRTARSKCPKP